MDQTDQPHAEIVFMGEAQVGKTSIIKQILKGAPKHDKDNDIAHKQYKPTIEDSYIREFTANESLCRLRLIDTAGGYTFPAMHRLWLKRARAFVLVCARDNPRSLNRIQSIYQEIQQERVDDFKNVIIVIAVNKTDLPQDKWILTDQHITSSLAVQNVPKNCIISTSTYENTGIRKLLKAMWNRNEQCELNKIQFDPLPSKLKPIVPNAERRASAFAVLFRDHQTPTIMTKTTQKDTTIDQQNSDDDDKVDQEYHSSISNYIKSRKIGRFSLGGLKTNFKFKKQSKTNNSTNPINFECNVS